MTVLRYSHSAVCRDLANATRTCLTIRAREFKGKNLTNEIQIFICSDSESEILFHVDIFIARPQLDLLKHQINSLTNLYHAMKQAYHTLDDIAARDLNKITLSNQRNFYCFAQPLILLWFGIDIDRWDCAFRRESLRKVEKVRSGMVALEREIQKLEHNQQVLQEVERIVQDLALSTFQWPIEFTHSEPRVPGDSIRNRLREWVRQHFVHCHRLKEIWSELLALLDGVIMIRTDWCKLSKTWSDKLVTDF